MKLVTLIIKCPDNLNEVQTYDIDEYNTNLGLKQMLKTIEQLSKEEKYSFSFSGL